MRIDKFLKVSRVIKRRTIGHELASKGRVSINGKVTKPGGEVKMGDIITLNLSDRELTIKVLDIKEYALKENASNMFEVIDEKMK